MPRTLSWLDRIVPISRTVQESARSHYDRKDIERLFELQRGDLRVQFQTLEELAEAMLYLATVFTHDLDGFAARYEPSPAPTIKEKGTRQDANG